jgi:hypothetical protein
MRTFSLSLLLLLAFVSNVSAQRVEEAPWLTLAPEGAGFSISVPSEATERTLTRPTYTLHSFTVNMGRVTFAASYTDYEKSDPDLMTSLTANRDKFIKTVGGTLVSSREITLDGHTGLDFTVDTPAMTVRSQVFQIGKRMFQTAALMFKDVDETRNVKRFFDSFKITKPSPERSVNP